MAEAVADGLAVFAGVSFLSSRMRVFLVFDSCEAGGDNHIPNFLPLARSGRTANSVADGLAVFADLAGDFAGILAGAVAFGGKVACIRGWLLAGDVADLAGIADVLAGIVAGIVADGRLEVNSLVIGIAVFAAFSDFVVAGLFAERMWRQRYVSGRLLPNSLPFSWLPGL